MSHFSASKTHIWMNYEPVQLWKRRELQSHHESRPKQSGSRSIGGLLLVPSYFIFTYLHMSISYVHFIFHISIAEWFKIHQRDAWHLHISLLKIQQSKSWWNTLLNSGLQQSQRQSLNGTQNSNALSKGVIGEELIVLYLFRYKTFGTTVFRK